MHRIHSIERLDRFRQLSSRETQLIVLASEGMIDKEIAAHLGISMGTVVTMWSRMRAKLGISSRISAVAVVVSAVSRVWELLRSHHEGDVICVLVNEKRVVLSCNCRACDDLGLFPGDSLNKPRGDAADWSWTEACNEPITFTIGQTDFHVECRRLQDTVLGQLTMYVFAPAKSENKAAVRIGRPGTSECFA